MQFLFNAVVYLAGTMLFAIAIAEGINFPSVMMNLFGVSSMFKHCLC